MAPYLRHYIWAPFWCDFIIVLDDFDGSGRFSIIYYFHSIYLVNIFSFSRLHESQWCDWLFYNCLKSTSEEGELLWFVDSDSENDSTFDDSDYDNEDGDDYLFADNADKEVNDNNPLENKQVQGFQSFSGHG
jgi:hypothetical protein